MVSGVETHKSSVCATGVWVIDGASLTTTSSEGGDLRSGEVRGLAPKYFGVKDPRTTWSSRQRMVDQFQLLRVRPINQDAQGRLTEAARILGLRVLDHVIVTKKGYYSFQESGLVG